MPHTYTEEEYYHAVALLCRGEYKKISAAREKASNWESTYESLKVRQEKLLENAQEELASFGIEIILRDSNRFPEPLRHIPWPPHALYIRGVLPRAWEKTVAMVGTRKATPEGLRFARNLGKELTTHGISIVSGLALGIDAASHEGVVANKGAAVAVLASGLDTVTPRTNQNLADAILKNGGCLISEYPMKTESLPHLFLERNRIVSGLAKAVLVIEAPARSGTLATARFAIEQNKDVFVVPGSITNLNYEGSHELLKQGASLLTKTEDITNYFGIDSPEKIQRENVAAHYSGIERAIIAHLTKAGAPVHTDALFVALDFPQSEITQALALLSINGVINEQSGKYYV